MLDLDGGAVAFVGDGEGGDALKPPRSRPRRCRAEDERARLEAAQAPNRPPAAAYYLKEDLRRSWEQPGERLAAASLTGRARRARASGVKMPRRMAKTPEAHRSGPLADYDDPISTGPPEGADDEVKTMERRAHGLRDQGFFKPKILAIHEARYAFAE